MCIVLVEDEAVIRMIVADALQDAGHIVVEFATAADAKAYCARPGNPVSAVLTDINMPGEEDGLDLAAYVAEDADRRHFAAEIDRHDAAEPHQAVR